MIEYVIAHNPDGRILAKASELLRSGELIAFPTDTSWIVACDPFSKTGVEKLYRLKGEEQSKHFSLICDSISRASELANINDNAFKTLKKVIPGHYTFIFKSTKKMMRVLKATKTDHEIGIRFIPEPLCEKIISSHDSVLLTTNITNEILGISGDDEIYSYLIEENIRGKLSMILDPGEFEFVGPSSIVSFVDDCPELIREGAGDLSKVL